jgi:hypothetical protein
MQISLLSTFRPVICTDRTSACSFLRRKGLLDIVHKGITCESSSFRRKIVSPSAEVAAATTTAAAIAQI